MQKVKKRQIKKSIQIFHSFKEQEEADVKYWKTLDPNKKLKFSEEALFQIYTLYYGKVPRLQRVYRIFKRK